MVKLIKETTDPICTRLSLGGNDVIGYYCVFRGNRNDAIACLEEVLEAMRSDQPIDEDRS